MFLQLLMHCRGLKSQCYRFDPYSIRFRYFIASGPWQV